MAVGSDGVLAGLPDRPRDGAVLDRPAVDEEELEPARGERDRSARRVAHDAQRARLRLEHLELAQRRPAEDLEDARAPVDRGRRVQRLPAVAA